MLTVLPVAALLLCSLSGLLALPVWIVVLTAIALATISYARHLPLFRRAGDLGMQDAIDQTLVASLSNGLLASGMAYGCGVALRVLSAAI
jgi:hypothetical protein